MASRPPACPRRPPPPYRETASHMRNRANPLPLARTTSGGMTKQNSRDEEQSHSLIQEQEHRLLSLQLLETRSINRALEERHREDGNEIEGLIHERAELFHANGSLWEALETARATIEHLQIEAQRMSKELSRQAVLVDDERKLRLSATGEIHPNKAEMATTAVATLHRNAPQLDPSTSGVRRTSPRSDNNVEHNSACPLVPKLEEHIQLSLRIMIGRWMEDVQATLGPENKEALEMPWVLHRLFSLCSDLIHDQHEELVKTLSGEGCPVERPDGSVTPADTAAFMRHLRRHHLTLFPLSGASLLITIDSIMMALSHSIIESKRWDQSTQNPEDVYRVLAESGLQKLIQEYLHIMVGCRLQQPEVKFTDDIGKVERYDPKVHSELVDGHAVKEWCTVVFPALLVVDGDDGEWNRQRNGVVVGQRFVLAKDEWYRRQEGRRN